MTISWKLVNPFSPSDVLLSSSSDADPAYFYSYMESNIFAKFLRSESVDAAPVYGGEEAESFVEDLAAQVVREAPHKFVGHLLSCLSCAFWKDKWPQDLTNLPDANPRKICGKVFKVGEVVWTCRQCAKDSTCVQCDACFKASDHEGHEVYFHRAAATSGGCCDCGDEEAWAIAGNCTKHSHKGNERDPLEALPEPVQKGLNAVMKGALGATISFSTAVVRGFNIEEKTNPYTKCLQIVREMHRGTWYEESSPSMSEEVSDIMKEVSAKHVREMECTFFLSLHNDDVHTYDEVTRSILMHVFESSDTEWRDKAASLTKMVDQDGFAVVAEVHIDGNFDKEQARKLNKLHTMAKKLSMPLGESKKGLLTSILPAPLIAMEKGVAAYLNWVQDLGKANDGICRLMTNVLLLDTTDLPSHAAAIINRNAESGIACGICRPTDIFDEYISDDPEASMSREFPIFLKQLSDYVDDLEGANPDIQLDANKGLNDKLTQEAVRLSTAPFSENCKRNALAVLLMASAYLFKRVKDRISSLVVIYQQDMVFKPVFSQTLTVLYPALYSLFARYIGTRSDEIFNTTVQVYTANRIVTMMSSDGYQEGLRPLPEPEHGHVCIAKMLAHTIYTTMLHIRCNLEDTSVWPPAADRDQFLKAHALGTQRHQQVFRDFEYVTENIVGNLNLLTGDRDQGLLWIWMAVCSMLQGMYSVKRAAMVHVEHEEQVMWHTSTNLTLEMESASTNIISNSLFPSMEALLAESQVASGKDDTYDMRTLQDLAVQRSSAVFAQGFEQWANRSHARDVGIRELGLNHDSHEPNSLLKEQGRYTASFLCLDQDVELPQNTTFMRFSVAEDLVSINIPLHRLVAKLFMYSAYNDLNLRPAFDAISSMSSNAVLSLADYPLRVMSFAYQVDNRMWVRNGQAVANLAFNYSHGPIVKYLKVMDIHAVQTALIALGEIHGPNQIVALMIDRCGVSKIMEKKYQYFEHAATNQARPGSNWARLTLHEHQGAMLCIFLKILIDVIMNTPSDLTAFNAIAAKNKKDADGAPVEYADSVESALSREVASLVLSGVSSLGQLQVAKAMVGGDKTVNDTISYQVMEKLCRKKAGEGEKMLEPNAETFKHFDPEYTHRSQDQLNKAVDEMREQRKKALEKKEDEGAGGGAKEEEAPLFLPEMVPASNRYFEPVRNLLFTPILYSVLIRSIELAISPKATSNQREAQTTSGELLLGPFSRVVAERVIYILTVHIHIKSRRRVKETIQTKQVYPGSGTMRSDQTMDIESTTAEESAPSFASAAESSSSSNAAFDCYEAGSLTVEKNGTLLQAIADLWHSPLVSDDPLYRDGLLWVMKQIALDERNEGAMELFASRGLAFRRRRSSTDAGLVDGKQAELQKRKETAQRSAMLNMSKQAAAFASMMDDLTSSDEDEPSTSSGTVDATSSGAAGAGTKPERSIPKCIVCRGNDSSSPMGTLCFLQPSSIVKNAILHHANTWHEMSNPLPEEMDHSYMKNIYRVVARRGCFVYKSAEDTSNQQSVRSASIVGRLAHGEHIVTRRRVSRWVQVVSPMQGWIEMYSERCKTRAEKLDSTSPASATNKMMFDHSSEDTEVALVTNLQPLSSLMFNKHGGCRLHASTCGHNIHYHCWNAYYASCVQQAERVWSNEFRAALDIRAGEFTCPLCKSISNAWLPFVPSREGQLSWSDEKAMSIDEPAKSILPLTIPSATLTKNTLNAVVLRLLDTPEIHHFDRNLESQQFVERCIHLHQHAWVDRQRHSLLAENTGYHDPTARREAELTRGVHILAGTIAYTIQSNQLVGRWTGNHTCTGPEAAHQTAFPTQEALEFAAEQLNLIRQMPNWFPGRENFEDSIGTPLKFLLAGRPTVPELLEESKVAPQPAPVLAYTDDTTMNARLEEKSMLRALATSPYNQIVSERSMPGEQHLVAVRRAFFDKGIPPSQLWGFLSVPLLSQDLHTISVLSVACASSAERARGAIALVALARLCQVVMEPAVTGVLKEQKKEISSLTQGAEGNGGDTSVRNISQPLPFRRTTSSETLEFNVSGGIDEGSSLQDENSDSTVTEIASLVQQLQNSLASATGIPIASNTEWTSAPSHVLRLLLEAWLPFLDYSLALLAALQSAAYGTVPPPPSSSPYLSEGAGVLALLSRLPALLTALELPGSLTDLLQSDFLKSAAFDWATQLSYIQRPDASAAAGTPDHLAPGATSRSALDPSVIKHRERVRFATRDNEFWHETSTFGYPSQVTELLSALSADEISTVIDKFRDELLAALGGSSSSSGGGGEGRGERAPMSPSSSGGEKERDGNRMEEDDEDDNSKIAQIARQLVAERGSADADGGAGAGADETEYRYQWRLLAEGEMGPMVEREMSRLVGGRFLSDASAAESVGGYDEDTDSSVMDTEESRDGYSSTSKGPTRHAVPRHISTALKRQRKDLSDAVAFACAVKDAIMKKMSQLELKSVEGHIDTRLDESVKRESLACLIDALMICSDQDLEGLKRVSRISADPALMGDKFGRLLVHKAKAKSAKELGVELKDPSTESLDLWSSSTSSSSSSSEAAPLNLKPAAGAQESTTTTTTISGSSSSNGGSNGKDNDSSSSSSSSGAGTDVDADEEEERMLSEPTIASWKLVGVDPVHRMVDETTDRRHATRYRDLKKNLGHFFTESPFVGSTPGCIPAYDLDGKRTSTAWSDLSHMGLFRSIRGGLIEMPRVYTDMIQRMRLPYKPQFDEQSRRIDEPAICLICGTIVRAGNRSKEIDSPAEMDSHLDAYPGECTLHARSCGGGHGVFMIMLHNWVLILNGPRSCKYPALYLDKNGEAGEGRGPNRPLQLSEERYKKLEDLYLNHQIASEISRKRLNQDRNIRLNYY